MQDYCLGEEVDGRGGEVATKAMDSGICGKF